MELDNTSSIKGIFVWLIIFRHKSEYGIKKYYIYKYISNNLGQKIVSMFLFYSSFGIYESLKKKGINYAKTLPIKSIIIFIKSQIILLMFLLANIFVLKKRISLKSYLLCMIFKVSIGNSYWFSFTIIILYIYSYLSFRFVKNPFIFGIVFINFICLVHIILVYNYYYPKMIMAVDNVLCFVFGFYYSFFRKYLEQKIMKNDVFYYSTISVTILIYYKILYVKGLLFISITNTLFALLVVFISMKVQFNNDLLKFFNSHSFSIYLLQRLVFMIVYKKNIFRDSNFIQISFEFTSIFFISSLFDKYTFFIDKLFKRKDFKMKKMDYIPITNIIIND